jgi:phage gp36-like protein
MSYASLPDLIERAGEDEILQVADRDDDGTADPDVIEAALAHADNTINGYLATRYTIPLSSVPPIVVTWAVAIGRYHLHRQGAPDYVVRDYKDALAALDKAQQGRIAVPGADGIAPAQGSEGAVRVDGPEPVFNQENLGGWL